MYPLPPIENIHNIKMVYITILIIAQKNGPNMKINTVRITLITNLTINSKDGLDKYFHNQLEKGLSIHYILKDKDETLITVF